MLDLPVKDRERKDYVAATGHDQHLAADYAAAMDLGIGVVREAIRWPMVDLGGGRYNWSSVKAVQDVATAARITPIWDLCHYGLPDGCDPFTDECRDRFMEYCRAAAKFVTGSAEPPFFFTPVNEITFFATGATDLEWMYPFAKGREDELKRALAGMAIAAPRPSATSIPTPGWPRRSDNPRRPASRPAGSRPRSAR